MVFSSFMFLFVFLPILILVYFAIPARYREARNAVLLLFSLIFYAYGGIMLLPLMIISIIINYIFGLLVSPKFSTRARKLLVIISVVANLSLLGYYKYAGFLIENLIRIGLPFTAPNTILPIGISFFTFQGMSYVLDVYRGDEVPERNIAHVALYISLFPQLVAGPIVRYTTITNEILIRKESLEAFSKGGIRFCFGFAKKMILANSLGALADTVFTLSVPNLTVSLSWLGALAYMGQIYFDFSAYSDMAIGLGHMFGFNFLENFNYPYISKTITEFWRRWHISLSTWFRDYVYIPLDGSRCSKKRLVLNILVVWSLTGFWHGAAWNFLLWGLYYAIILLGERFVWKGFADNGPSFLRRIYVLLVVIIGWVLFRSDSMTYCAAMIKSMFGGAIFSDGRTGYYLRMYGWVLLTSIVASLPIKLWLKNFFYKRKSSYLFSLIHTWAPGSIALALLILSYMKLIGSTFNPFIYFRF
jgi:alginate O-acetyltransferase complex protein AlgI